MSFFWLHLYYEKDKKWPGLIIRSKTFALWLHFLICTHFSPQSQVKEWGSCVATETGLHWSLPASWSEEGHWTLPPHLSHGRYTILTYCMYTSLLTATPTECVCTFLLLCQLNTYAVEPVYIYSMPSRKACFGAYNSSLTKRWTLLSLLIVYLVYQYNLPVKHRPCIVHS